ncbi:ribonuclease P protein component [Nesterenkonia alkaliphila]|uniref:Ribonuclease P protein component n=1 Tax=Nesterenkonia alkaliphila TaxID=1463631 RepID=A0A7K1UH57_9MICC|nr:ribonuclease P protein component [Nesterenkonia alkaliphila]MVT25411.1 ribonuclease P protein component [Nesterenkonia alkaliphila]GFZ83299.1 ribonuclease P protein component [Nesterenkonia alkaliphila]
MLPQEHRITRPQDFSAVMRRGSRAGTATVVVSVLVDSQHQSPQWRCGFIVSKAVGNAVVRHRTVRRLRHLVAELLRSGEIPLPQSRSDFVVRALAQAPESDHQQLRNDLASGIRRALKRAVP